MTPGRGFSRRRIPSRFPAPTKVSRHTPNQLESGLIRGCRCEKATVESGQGSEVRGGPRTGSTWPGVGDDRVARQTVCMLPRRASPRLSQGKVPGTERIDAAPAAASSGRSGSSVIFFELAGGPSQHDTYDPKPHAPAEIRGIYGLAKTKLPGVVLSDRMARQAKLMDKMAVIRSMHSSLGNRSQTNLPRSFGPASSHPRRPEIDRRVDLNQASVFARSCPETCRRSRPGSRCRR